MKLDTNYRGERVISVFGSTQVSRAKNKQFMH